MWQAVGKIRYKEISLKNGILIGKKAYKDIWPFTLSNLPTEFTKVTDSRSAIRFERRYSPLGYDSLVRKREEQKGGDPLEWVLKQAKFVKFALNLIYALTRQDGDNALKQSQDFQLKNFTYPAGAYDCETLLPMPRDKGNALIAVPHVIEILVNANTENVRSKLVVHYKGKLDSVIFYNASIEAIWSMVGDLAIRTQQGQGSAYFVKCKYCQTPFLAKDKRQQFCPIPEGYTGRKQSLCGLKYRQRELQARKRDKEGQP
jgi:hypothetical protein